MNYCNVKNLATVATISSKLLLLCSKLIDVVNIQVPTTIPLSEVKFNIFFDVKTYDLKLSLTIYEGVHQHQPDPE